MKIQILNHNKNKYLTTVVHIEDSDLSEIGHNRIHKRLEHNSMDIKGHKRKN
jgi:hypothetical protein